MIWEGGRSLGERDHGDRRRRIKAMVAEGQYQTDPDGAAGRRGIPAHHQGHVSRERKRIRQKEMDRRRASRSDEGRRRKGRLRRGRAVKSEDRMVNEDT